MKTIFLLTANLIHKCTSCLKTAQIINESCWQFSVLFLYGGLSWVTISTTFIWTRFHSQPNVKRQTLFTCGSYKKPNIYHMRFIDIPRSELTKQTRIPWVKRNTHESNKQMLEMFKLEDSRLIKSVHSRTYSITISSISTRARSNYQHDSLEIPRMYAYIEWRTETEQLIWSMRKCRSQSITRPFFFWCWYVMLLRIAYVSFCGDFMA